MRLSPATPQRAGPEPRQRGGRPEAEAEGSEATLAGAARRGKIKARGEPKRSTGTQP
jgi:hypothetical protein